MACAGRGRQRAGMTLLRCATRVVADLTRACTRFVEWMDYSIVEMGKVDEDLAAAWLTPASEGRLHALLRPASGAGVYLRFVEGDCGGDDAPRHGWAAIDLCVKDVEAVKRRMQVSPFEILSPPPSSCALTRSMRLRGDDLEVLHLTEMLVDGPLHGLPRPQSLIDRPFSMVLACTDLGQTADWLRDVVGLTVKGDGKVSWQGQVFLRLEQATDDATSPTLAMTTLAHPDIARLAGHWAAAPAARAGVLYEDRLVGMLRMPEGALLEIIDGARD